VRGALIGEEPPELDVLGPDAEREQRRGQGLVGVDERAVEVEDGELQGNRGLSTVALLPRPTNSPVPTFSSQRAPQDAQAQASNSRLAR
jgi:hypothetical protein